jgi:hypothetical protein
VSSFLANQTEEKIPITSVYQSQNALVKMAGIPLLRVSDATARLQNTVGTYAEVGSRIQIPYVGPVRVSGTINRAYVNGAEWRLVIGSSSQQIGRILRDSPVTDTREQSLNDAGINATNTSWEDDVDNYPIRTDIELEINRSQIEQMQIDGSISSTIVKMVLVLRNCILDSTGITFNANGLITSGPITFEGEFAYFEIEKA